MKNVVISGSSKEQEKINKWINYFESHNYNILDYPRPIEKDKFLEIYPKVHTEYFENMTKTDILFIMNEDRNDVVGYIGSETFAELTFGLSQNLVYDKNIELILLKMPSEKVGCYDEIVLWLHLGWIKIFDSEGGL